MTDKDSYIAMLNERVTQIKAANEAVKTERDSIKADMLSLLSPLEKLGALLPDKVKEIINKYKA